MSGEHSGSRAEDRHTETSSEDLLASLPEPQDYDRVLSSMCTVPHPAARAAALHFLESNPGDPETFPAIAEVETDAVERLGRIAGLRDPAGYIASGGTEANIQAVRAAVARSPVEDPNVVAPTSAHFSFHKAADILNIELRTVETSDYRAVPADMAAAADAETVLVVGVAGSTEYGRVDPIPALGEVATEANAAFHVDAAWGGFLLPFTAHDWSFADAAVDTLTIDPHKTGRAPIPAGGLLARDPALLSPLSIDTPYLESGTQMTLTGTRSGTGVAGTWGALEALWPEGYRAEADRALCVADWLHDALADRGYNPIEPELPIVTVELGDGTFRELREAGWRIARTGDKETRIVVMPHVTRDRLETFLDALDESADCGDR